MTATAHVRRVVRDWLATELRTPVGRMRVTRSAYASSAVILNVHMTLADGKRMRVVYKGPDASGVKPEFVIDRGREAWMYRSILPLDGLLDAPRLLASGSSNDGGNWLLMEWVGSVDLTQVGSRAVWCEAAARLARVHSWGESHVKAISQGSPLRWDDPNLHMRLARRAHVPNDPLDQLWRGYHVVAKRLAAMPRTLVHGDLNASNVLVTRAADGTRVRFIDWETAGIGPGLIDLASLTSGALPERHRTSMIAAYRSNLGASRLGAMSTDDFEDALRWCRLALAVQWLGWAPGWSPPAAHTHDWRSQAMVHALRLGLLDRA